MMSTDKPPIEGEQEGISTPISIDIAPPELKRMLRDLLVQDEVSDSDVEMLEKNAMEDERSQENPENIDPDMCVECGDQALS